MLKLLLQSERSPNESYVKTGPLESAYLLWLSLKNIL